MFIIRCIYIKYFLKRQHFLFHVLSADFPPPVTKQNFGYRDQASNLKVTLNFLISLVIGRHTLWIMSNNVTLSLDWKNSLISCGMQNCVGGFGWIPISSPIKRNSGVFSIWFCNSSYVKSVPFVDVASIAPKSIIFTLSFLRRTTSKESARNNLEWVIKFRISSLILVWCSYSCATEICLWCAPKTSSWCLSVYHIFLTRWNCGIAIYPSDL